MVGLSKSLRKHIEAEAALSPKPQPQLVKSDPRKTAAMRLIEMQTGQSIESLIARGKVRDIAKRLAIQYSTVSKWRRKLGLIHLQVQYCPSCNRRTLVGGNCTNAACDWHVE